MPCEVMLPMEQRTQMLLDWQSGVFCKADLSRKYGVSRKTVYKWLHRYESGGIDSLGDRSVPRRSPNAIPEALVDIIVAEKRNNKSRGSKKIHVQLQTSYPEIALPSVGTIGNVLKRKGV